MEDGFCFSMLGFIIFVVIILRVFYQASRIGHPRGCDQTPASSSSSQAVTKPSFAEKRKEAARQAAKSYGEPENNGW